MINTKVLINGSEYSDINNLKVTKSTQENIATSNFSMDMPSPYGRYKNVFDVGDEIKVEVLGVAGSNLFTGLIEKVNFDGDGTKEKLKMSGRDYTLRLMDKTVNPVVYTDSEVSTIVKNLIDLNAPEITYNNVEITDLTLSRIAFNQPTIYEAIKQLSELSGYYFYIDEDKDLHFEKKKSISSGYTLNNTNIISTNFNETREGMANEVWIYGGRYLTGYRETPKSDGGSVFTLISKPHNTRVDYLGSILKGGVWEMAVTPISGIQYYVSYDTKNLIFVSGTDYGNHLIPSGGSVIVDYDRMVPVVKYGRNNSSINQYGIKTSVTVDKNITDPLIAYQTLVKKLENSNPFKGLEIDTKGWFNVTPGQTVDVELENFGVSDTLDIIGADYNFTKNNCQSDKVITIKADKKINDITDKIKEIDDRLKRLESDDITEAEMITRYETAEDSLQVVGSSWKVYSRILESGLGFVLGNGSYSILGTNTLGYSGGLPSFGIVVSGGYY